MVEKGTDHQRPPEGEQFFSAWLASSYPCSNYVEREDYTKALLEYFQPELEEDERRRFLLWGTAGVGKTQIAAHFVAKYASTIAKHVIWIRADNFESFVCDFTQIPRILTGKDDRDELPKRLKWMLKQVVDLLDDRPQDWFLILDDCYELERGHANPESIYMVDFLPTCGRTLITSSFTVVTPLEQDIQLMPALQLRCEKMQVKEMSAMEAATLYRSTIPKLLVGDLETIFCHPCEDLLGKLDLRPLFLSVVFAVVNTLQIDLGSYMDLFKSKVRRFRPVYDRETELGDIPPSLSIALTITLDCVRDLSTHSMDILQYMALLHPREIKPDFLWQLPRLAILEFEDFKRALDVLVDLAILRRKKYQRTGRTTLMVHSAVHLWISSETKRLDQDEYLHEAIQHFGHLLQQNLNRKTFHQLLPHVRELIRHGFGARVQSQSFLQLLRLVAECLVRESMPNTADRLVTQAVTIAINHWPILPRPNKTPPAIVLQHINLKQLKAEVAYELSKFRIAERELKSALSVVDSPVLDVSEDTRASLRNSIREHLAMPLREQRKFDEELKIRKDLLAIDCNRHGVRYFWKLHAMAVCLYRRGDIDQAFKHSSEALEWIRQGDRMADPFCQSWIAFHAQLLQQLGQPRASLELCLLPSLDKYVDKLDNTRPPLWEIGYSVVCALYKLHEFDEQERVSIEILGQTGISELDEEVLAIYIKILCLLSDAYLRQGRLIEAEALLRHAIDRVEAEASHPDQMFFCHYDLVHCLFKQSRDVEALEHKRSHPEDVQKSAKSRNTTIESELQRDRECLAAYLTGLDKLREGSTFEDDPFFEDSRALLEDAGDRYGLLLDRLTNDTDPRTDLDPLGIGWAKNSEIMDLLEISFGGDSFIDFINGLHSKRADMKGQKLITEYFKVCKCHRYRAGRYLNDDNFLG